jgi:hypothetical protein
MYALDITIKVNRSATGNVTLTKTVQIAINALQAIRSTFSAADIAYIINRNIRNPGQHVKVSQVAATLNMLAKDCQNYRVYGLIKSIEKLDGYFYTVR